MLSRAEITNFKINQIRQRWPVLNVSAKSNQILSLFLLLFFNIIDSYSVHIYTPFLSKNSTEYLILNQCFHFLSDTDTEVFLTQTLMYYQIPCARLRRAKVHTGVTGINYLHM